VVFSWLGLSSSVLTNDILRPSGANETKCGLPQKRQLKAPLSQADDRPRGCPLIRQADKRDKGRIVCPRRWKENAFRDPWSRRHHDCNAKCKELACRGDLCGQKPEAPIAVRGYCCNGRSSETFIGRIRKVTPWCLATDFVLLFDAS
jgi:hypothetical protein